jgi:hypothetical protein
MAIRFNGVRIKPCAAGGGGGGGNTVTYIDPLGDSTVSLLLHMDGTNNSTTFTDNSFSPKTPTLTGSPVISTAASKFGGASGYFNGSSFLTFSGSPDFDLSGGTYTMEGWVNPSSLASRGTIIGKHVNWMFFIVDSTTLMFYVDGFGQINRTVPTISTGTWNHFAVVSNANTISIYWNGVKAGASASASTPNYAQFSAVTVGADRSYAPLDYFNGYIDEIRLSKGVARYTTDFTPPAAAFQSADPGSNLPAAPAVGDVAYTSTKSYICTSSSPVTWKEYSSTGITYTP